MITKRNSQKLKYHIVNSLNIAIAFFVVLVVTSTTMAQTIWNGTVNTSWYNSSQTEFTITTAEQLAGLAQLVNNGNGMAGRIIKLGNNIVLNDTTNWMVTTPINLWIPIGGSQYRPQNDPIGRYFREFSGTFDGAGFVISGVYINSSSDYQGLFGKVNSSGIIKNLGVTVSSIRGGGYVGGLVGYSSGTITNCYATGNVWGIAIGFSEGSCVFSHSYIGGLAGSGGTITNSHATGNVSGTAIVYSESNNTCFSSYVGGLVGFGGTITNSYAIGNVSGANVSGTGPGSLANYTGGLVGVGGTITNSYATGNVSGTGNNIGGLAGSSSTITNSYYNRTTSGQNDNNGRGTPKTTFEMRQQGTYIG
ncbi:MAG: hypothetical protein FWD47_14595 [Treponema sp.]|nr:hypothetical protein [Treponema sp.]